MDRVIALLLTALALVFPGSAALAEEAQPGARVVSRVSWVEEWDPASGRWVRIDEIPVRVVPPADTPVVISRTDGGATVSETVSYAQPVRFIGNQRGERGQNAGIAAFGPFRVIDGKRAALVGTTDAASPGAFAEMLALYPGIEVIEFLDAPGTSHDLANLRLGRAIRAAGLATHVPAGGSARSGAVELFLAGTRRTADPGALFAVHSWRDEAGREPADFAPDAPENRLYLDYYAEMGMSAEEARAFYAMTNSVPHAGALWLEGAEMARWIAPAARRIEGGAQDALRLAVARSGALIAEAMRSPFSRPAAPVTRPTFAPVLAYAYGGTGLLDSWTAFP